MSAPVIMTTLFVGGLVAIPTLGRWAVQVTEVLASLLATATVLVVILYLCDRWPDYFANPRMPVGTMATPFAE
ncbi:hypothetical protein LOK46_17115 [Methylobacterium sp. NMS14P]|uniref:hypothetical protein n=1 Tax=unclassified Methylobacterium TaxID=2615210 RepID=UPI002359F1EA|nr:hypothetical protein [Methylobacterium sp. NMS14P]WCS22906.1 hypothetical protein LOK46_17115 [Methylobacterium sp. NMS14P]